MTAAFNLRVSSVAGWAPLPEGSDMIAGSFDEGQRLHGWYAVASTPAAMAWPQNMRRVSHYSLTFLIVAGTAVGMFTVNCHTGFLEAPAGRTPTLAGRGRAIQ